MHGDQITSAEAQDILSAYEDFWTKIMAAYQAQWTDMKKLQQWENQDDDGVDVDQLMRALFVSWCIAIAKDPEMCEMTNLKPVV